MPPPDTTSNTLLSSLRCPDDQEAWALFYKLYQPWLYRTLKKADFQDSDCEDIVNNTLLRIYRDFADFQHGGGKGQFRCWLKRYQDNCVKEFLRQQRKPDRPAQAEDILHLENAPPAYHEAWIEEEHRAYILRRVVEVVQEAFDEPLRTLVVENLVNKRPVAQLARELGIEAKTAYYHISKARERLNYLLGGLLD